MKRSFTLMELLIVIGLLAILLIVAIFMLNPWGQIAKSQDAKRKNDLSSLRKVLEDWYGDKNCYPQPSQICYNDSGGTSCNICGTKSGSPQISPYLQTLPCDPQYPQKDYLYEVDSTACPTWYRIYTNLSNTQDPVISQVGCTTGCGIPPNYIYNYGVSSPNAGLSSTPACTGTSYCIKTGCNVCGGKLNCLSPLQCIQTDGFYSDSNCTQACEFK